MSTDDCSAVWPIRVANPQTPDRFFDNWSANDTSCCLASYEPYSPWNGLGCRNGRVVYIYIINDYLPVSQRVSVVPASIRQLSELERMEIRSSNIGVLPDVFDSFRKFTSLSVSDTPMHSLPSSFASLPLVNLALRNTTINTAGIQPICGLSQLLTLDLTQSSHLHSVDCSFATLKSLLYAVFSDSALSSFHAFDHCEQFELGCVWPALTLRLDGNQLSSVPMGTLKLLGSAAIDLSRNKITQINSRLLLSGKPQSKPQQYHISQHK